MMRNLRTVRVCTDRASSVFARPAPVSTPVLTRTITQEQRAPDTVPKLEGEDMDEDGRPAPIGAPDNLKVTDDAPATPSDSDPAVPSASSAVDDGRDDEMSNKEELGDKVKESFNDMLSGKGDSGGTDTFDTLGGTF